MYMKSTTRLEVTPLRDIPQSLCWITSSVNLGAQELGLKVSIAIKIRQRAIEKLGKLLDEERKVGI
jgi:uncharacterized protein YggE